MRWLGATPASDGTEDRLERLRRERSSGRFDRPEPAPQYGGATDLDELLEEFRQFNSPNLDGNLTPNRSELGGTGLGPDGYRREDPANNMLRRNWQWGGRSAQNPGPGWGLMQGRGARTVV